MSPSHFIRRFQALFQVTPHQFRIQARLDHARYLLATTELSVTQVCMDVGMSSVGSFSDLFTRRFGEPPSACKRNAREQSPDLLFPGCLSLMAQLPEDSANRDFREASQHATPVEYSFKE